jgi:hypothetical protein
MCLFTYTLNQEEKKKKRESTRLRDFIILNKINITINYYFIAYKKTKKKV